MQDNQTEVPCPKCGQSLSTPAEYAGRNGKCPHCDEHFIIPASEVVLQPSERTIPQHTSSTVQATQTNDFVYTMASPGEYRNFAWRRWSARWIDIVLGYVLTVALFCGLAYLSGATQIGLEFWRWIARPENMIIDIVITSGLSFFSDALVFALFGQTLGKKICGVSVCTISGSCISRMSFFLRDFDVLIRGLWFGIPLLVIIPQSIQYNRVSKGQATSYDEGKVYQSRPTRGKLWYDILIIIAVFFIGGLVRAALK